MKSVVWKLSRQFLIILLCFTLIVSSADIIVEGHVSDERDSENGCYGFVIPLPSYENIAGDPDVQYAVLNLVNDLLRLGVPVYWVSESIVLESKGLGVDRYVTSRSFDVGSFVVPFTGNISLDAQVTVVVYDYAFSHELYDDMGSSVELYMVVAPFALNQVYELVEPHTVFYFGDGVSPRALDWYVSSMSRAGFLSNVFLADAEIVASLDPDEFTAFIWPGGLIFDDIGSDIGLGLRLLRQYRIQQFVADGGGFIGSCYGAFAASSGMRIIPYLLPKYYFPRLPSYFFLSLQDCLLAQAMPGLVNISVQKSESPVLYGVSGTIHGSWLRGGPVYVWLGKNTQSLATVDSVNLSWIRWFSSGEFPIVFRLLNRWSAFTTDKTIWTTSEYHKGKVVTFGDHPELGSIKLKRVIHNSVFYVSSSLSNEVSIDFSYPLLAIETIGENSLNLSLGSSSSLIFEDIYIQIDSAVESLDEMLARYENITLLINDLVDQNTMDVSYSYQMRSSGLWQFDEMLQRTRQYFDAPFHDQDTMMYLHQLDSINQLLEEKNVSIHVQITKLHDFLDSRFTHILTTIDGLLSTFDDLEYELQHYDNTSGQNEDIIALCEVLKSGSWTIDKNTPEMNFKSLKLLREAWYLYESLKATE